MASGTEMTVRLRPAKGIVLPTDLGEAAAIMSQWSKPRSWRTWSMTPPTSPVAPTTAIFMLWMFDIVMMEKGDYRMRVMVPLSS